jgi:transmembrane sensor
VQANYNTLEQHYQQYELPEDFLSDDSFCNYCKGTPEKDVRYWKEWLKVHPRQSSAFHEAERMVRVIGVYDNGFEDAVARLSDSLYATPVQQPKVRRLPVRQVAAAAAVLLAAGAALFMFRKQASPAKTMAANIQRYDTVETGNAKVRRVQLEDGSAVTLNSNSRLLVPADYNQHNRKVVLEGEAFFDVATDAKKPFSVQSKGVETRVLGTSFNVQAYMHRAGLKVTVVSGKVAVKAGTAEPVMLQPDQQLQVMADGTTAFSAVAAKSYRSWVDGELFFDHETLEDMAITLGAHFDREFIFADQYSRKELFTASFARGASLDKVLRLLSIGRNIRFTQKGNTIIVGKAGH